MGNISRNLKGRSELRVETEVLFCSGISRCNTSQWVSLFFGSSAQHCLSQMSHLGRQQRGFWWDYWASEVFLPRLKLIKTGVGLGSPSPAPVYSWEKTVGTTVISRTLSSLLSISCLAIAWHSLHIVQWVSGAWCIIGCVLKECQIVWHHSHLFLKFDGPWVNWKTLSLCLLTKCLTVQIIM